jgi:hypothetical protein
LFVPDPELPAKTMRAHGMVLCCAVGMEIKALSFVVLGAIGRRSIHPYYRTAAHFSCETSKLLQDDGYAFETASHGSFFIIGFAE